jgi:hypothetical protein
VDEQSSRRSAYAEVLSGLRDLADDGATQHFDATVSVMVDARRLSPDDAAVLRYWQREGLRNQAEHIVATASTALAALDEARRAAREATSHADAIWSGRDARVDRTPRPTNDPVSSDPVSSDPVSSDPVSPQLADQAAPAADEVVSRRGRHRAAPVQPPTVARNLDDLRDLPQASPAMPEAPRPDIDPPVAETRTVEPPAPAPGAPTRSLFAPTNVVPPTPVTTTRRLELPLPPPPTGRDVGSATREASFGDAAAEPVDAPAARRRRLLVAGLTVRDDVPDRPPFVGDDRPEAG